MNKLPLFDSSSDPKYFDYPLTPGFQDTDTSIEAAESLKPDAEDLRAKCYWFLRRENLTADEIASLLRKSVLSIRPRIAEMNASGLIEDSGERRGGAAVLVKAK